MVCLRTKDSPPFQDHATEIEKKRGEAESLQGHLAKLRSLGQAEDLHPLQIKVDDCSQLFEEASLVVERRKLALTQLAEFLQSHASASTLLHQVRQTVETTKSMSKKQSESLKKDLDDAIRDVKALEPSAISLDGILTKAQYHLKGGSPEQRTSCRATTDQLTLEVERIQNLLGTKQSEADALAILKKAFQDQKEELLRSIEDIEERTDRERLKELTRQALQHRSETWQTPVSSAFSLLGNSCSYQELIVPYVGNCLFLLSLSVSPCQPFLPHTSLLPLKVNVTLGN